MKKRQDIELLRVISAFGIVWFHSGAVGNDIAYSGLIVFLVLSLYLSARNAANTKKVSDRAQRLLVPWLVWYTIYGLINILRHKPLIPIDNGIVSGILAGPSIHLWFMPFIFFTLVVFDWLRKQIPPRLIGYACGILAVIVFFTATEWRPWSFRLGAPYAQFAHALNGALIGVFLAYYYNLPVLVRSSLLLLILALAAYLTMLPLPGVGTPYLFGVGICVAVLLLNRDFPAGFSINWLSECTLGIYLIHPILFMVLNKTKFASGLSIPVMAFLLSAITVMLIKRIAPDASKYVV